MIHYFTCASVVQFWIWKSRISVKIERAHTHTHTHSNTHEHLHGQHQQWLSLFLQTLNASSATVATAPPHGCAAYRLGGSMTSNHGVTFELAGPGAGGYSHLGVLVLTQRLLVQLIAICIALLVSRLCLCDISIFFSPFSFFFFCFFSSSPASCLSPAPPSRLRAFWGEELDSVWCVIKYSWLK